MTEVTTDHQKQNRYEKASSEGRSSPQELEEGPRSGPHLLVAIKHTHTQNIDDVNYMFGNLLPIVKGVMVI